MHPISPGIFGSLKFLYWIWNSLVEKEVALSSSSSSIAFAFGPALASMSDVLFETGRHTLDGMELELEQVSLLGVILWRLFVSVDRASISVSRVLVLEASVSAISDTVRFLFLFGLSQEDVSPLSSDPPSFSKASAIEAVVWRRRVASVFSLHNSFVVSDRSWSVEEQELHAALALFSRIPLAIVFVPRVSWALSQRTIMMSSCLLLRLSVL